MNQSYHFNWKRFLTDFVLICVLLSVTVYLVMIAMAYKDISIKSAEYKAAEVKLLEMEASYISDEFGVIVNALTFLSKTISENEISQERYHTLAEEWIRFLDAIDIYDRAVFISADGMSALDIQFDQTGE